MFRKTLCIILSIIPAIGSLIVINRIEPYVFGLPFILFWLILWVILTSVFLLVVNALDPANKGEDEE